MTPIRVGLCGTGTVGSRVVNLFHENAEIIAQRLGGALQLSLVGSRSGKGKCDLSLHRVTRNVLEVAEDPEVDVLIELIGGTDTAYQLVKTALTNHKHVVTANKALIAEHGEELATLALSNKLMLRFEAAVAGGIPIIESMCNSFGANQVRQVVGIINGTCNYILTAMHKDGLAFNQALASAKQLGYAEADPSFDIEGIDAAHKISILASVAFGTRLDYYNASVEGISSIELQDIACARKLGYIIKHLGLTRLERRGDIYQYQLRVHPALIPANSLLAQIDGATNALLVDSDPLQRSLLVGQGAGAGPTASAIMADVLGVARVSHSTNSYPPLGFQPEMRNAFTLLPIEEVETTNYLRMYALDKPGVLAQITSIFAREKNSIESIWQQEVDHSVSDNKAIVPIVMLTKSIAEYKMTRIIASLERLEEVHGKVRRIRVEYLDPPSQHNW